MRWPRLGRRPKDGTEKPNPADLAAAARDEFGVFDPDRYADLIAKARLDRPVRDHTARDLQGEPQ